MINELLKAGLANTTDVVSNDDTSKRVTVRCAEGKVLELRGDIARMFGYLNSMAIGASDKEGFILALPATGNNIFIFIPMLLGANIMVMLLFPFFVLLQQRKLC